MLNMRCCPKPGMSLASLLALLCLSGLYAAEQTPTHTKKPDPVITTGMLTLDGDLNDRQAYRLEQAILVARERQLQRIILTIQGESGKLSATREMMQALWKANDLGLETIALIDGLAVGPAAMLAYANKKIYVTETATIGNVGLALTDDGAAERQASLLRADLKQAASRQGWSKALLLKMVAADQQLYLVKHKDGTSTYVIEDDWQTYLAANPSVDADNRQQVIVILGKNRLLTPTGREAVQLGLATGIVPNQDALLSQLEIPAKESLQLDGLKPSASLSNPLVSKGPTTSTKPADSKKVPGSVGYIHIKGMIDRGKERYFKRALDTAKEQGLERMVVHLDTDGGLVDSGRKMLKLALDQAHDGPEMIAFVGFRAISAGAMIAYGHDKVYISESASIGDIGVIFVGADGSMEYGPEKIETVVRSLLRQAGEIRGWDIASLMKMTARNQKLYKINKVDGSEDYVIEDDLPAYLAENPEVDPDDTSQVIMDMPEDRLLTLTGTQAVQRQMATGHARDIDDLYGQLGIDANLVVDLSPTTTEQVSWYLASLAPTLAGLAMLFIFLELKTPGVGLWAILALCAGAAFLIAQYYMELVTNVEIVLMMLGLALIVLEVLTAVGGGIIGIAGGIVLVTGLIMAFVPNELVYDITDKQFRDALTDGALRSSFALLIITIGLAMFIYLLPRSGLANRLAVQAEIGGTSAGKLEADSDQLVGKTGQTVGILRPAGQVLIAGRTYSAQADLGAFIDDATEVIVTKVNLGELTVKPTSSGEAKDDAEASA